MSTDARELAPPLAAINDEKAREMVRLWVAAGSSHVALRTGEFDRETEIQVWGLILADITRQAVAAIAGDKANLGTVHSVHRKIDRTYRLRLKKRLALDWSERIKATP